MSYATPEALKDQLHISDQDDDLKISVALEAASQQIDSWCGQRFTQDASVVAREFYAESPSCCPVDVDGQTGISTVTGLVVKLDDDGDGTFETTLTISTHFLLLPRNAAADSPVRPYTELLLVDGYQFPRHANGRAGVQVTAKFGWPAVPDAVEKACLIQAADLYKAKDAAFGVAGSTEFGVLRVRSSLHPLAAGLLAGFRKPAVG